MKRLLLLLALPSALTFTSCDKKIPYGDRRIPAIDSLGVSKACLADSVIQRKTVLIEEFTGVTCNNCPSAAKAIRDLQNLYPCRINAIAIHSSNFANPTADYPADFRTNVGKNIYDWASPFGVPSGLINRLNFGTPTFANQFNNFQQVSSEILEQEVADIAIRAELNFDTITRVLNVSAEFTVQQALGSNLDLFWSAMLTENNIVAAQKLPDNSKDPDYVHQHVLRAAFNGTFGDRLTTLGSAVDDQATVSSSLTVDNSWVAENLEVVVFIYDDNSKEVIQSKSFKLKL